jgi:hypothetical protein
MPKRRGMWPALTMVACAVSIFALAIILQRPDRANAARMQHRLRTPQGFVIIAGHHVVVPARAHAR